MKVSCLWIKHYYKLFFRRLNTEIKQGFQMLSFFQNSPGALQSGLKSPLVGSESRLSLGVEGCVVWWEVVD